MAYGTVNVDAMTTSDGYTSAGTYGFKNRIINGNMVISQRNGTSSVTPTDAQYVLDRFWFGLTQASKFTCQQNAGSVTPPVGFTNYLGVTSSSSYSVISSDYFYLTQSIEGLNTADLAWGTANAKTVTLSFQVYSNLTGTFGGSINNGGSYNRSYPFTYSIPVANTWTTISVTIAGDTSGTWTGATNAASLVVNWGLGAGSSWSGTAGAWGGGNLKSATGAVSVVGTSGATFYITGVQLEKGSTATSFDYRPYGAELSLCQRYCYKLMPGIQLPKMRELDRSRTNFFSMPVQMRTTVTVGAMSTTDSISVTISNQSDRGFSMYALVPGDGYGAQIDTQALVTAEL